MMNEKVKQCDRLIEEAGNLLNEKKYDRAVVALIKINGEYENVLSSDGYRRMRLNTYLGLAYYHQEKYENAIGHFSVALEVKEASKNILYWRAESYYYLDQEELAIAGYKRVLELDPHYPNVHCFLGLAAETQEKFELAEKWYVKALEVDPNDVESAERLWVLQRPDEITDRVNQCSYLIEQAGDDIDEEKYDHAVATLLKASAEYTSEISLDRILRQRLNSKLGSAYLDQEKYEKAIEYFNMALEAKKTSKPDLSWRAYCYDELEQYEKAKADYHRVLELDPLYPDVHYFLGLMAENADDFKLAEEWFTKALQVDKDDTESAKKLKALRDSNQAD